MLLDGGFSHMYNTSNCGSNVDLESTFIILPQKIACAITIKYIKSVGELRV